MKSNVLHLLNDPEGCSSKNPAPHRVVRNAGKEEQGRNRCHHICGDGLAPASCFLQRVFLLFYGTTLLPAAVLVPQVQAPPLRCWDCPCLTLVPSFSYLSHPFHTCAHPALLSAHMQCLQVSPNGKRGQQQVVHELGL